VGCLVAIVAIAAYTLHNTEFGAKRGRLTVIATILLFFPISVALFFLGHYLDHRNDDDKADSGKQIVDYVKDQLPPVKDNSKILLRIDRFQFGLEPDKAYTNVFITYTGHAAIKSASQYIVFILDTKGKPLPSSDFRESENRSWEALQEAFKNKASQNTFPPHHSQFFSVVFPNPSPQQIESLENGEAAMLSIGKFDYSDEYGDHQKEFCVWYYASQFVYCKEHNN